MTANNPYYYVSLECNSRGPISIPVLAHVLTEQCFGVDTQQQGLAIVSDLLTRRSLVIVDTINGESYVDLPSNA